MRESENTVKRNSMNTEVAVIPNEARALTAAEVKGHVQLIQRVMESVMKEGVHYGTIPGTDKPALYKAGSEVLLTTFRIAVNPRVEDLSTGDEIRYRVFCTGTHQTSGIVIGTGLGECSSGEEKYKWRRAVCEEEFDGTPETRRRVKFGRKQQGHYTVQQVRTEPADVANTVLKMAKKRGQIDFTLTALAASDCFNQDLEDMPDEVREAVTEGEQRPTVQQPRAKSEAAPADPSKKLESGQLKFIRKKLEGGTVDEKKLCVQFGVAALEDIAFADINKVLVWVGEQA
jgi:hypothetical protein